MKVTKEKLEELAIYDVSSKLRKNKYYCEYTDMEHIILPSYTIKQALDTIFTDFKYEIHMIGVEEGKKIRSEEFKTLLNNE